MAPAPHFMEDLMMVRHCKDIIDELVHENAVETSNYIKELARLMAFKLTVKEAMRMAEHNPHEALDMIEKALKGECPDASTD